MARSTVIDLYEDIAGYSHAVLCYVDESGFPVNVPTEYSADATTETIELRGMPPSRLAEGKEVNVIFSHIRPYPGVGYDQRRYVSVSGRVTAVNGSIVVSPQRVHGWDESRMHFFELCERSVPHGLSYMQKLGEQRGEEIRPRMAIGWLVFLATRLPFLTATIVPILLGAVIARADGFSAWWLTVLALVGGSFIHLGLNIANDVSDATSGADTTNVNPTMFSGGSRVIQYGLVSKDAMRRASIGCYAVGIAVGIVLAATRGVELLWIGAAGLFLSIFYTAPPLRLVHRGLGEICVALGFGPIMVLGSYFVVAQQLTFDAFYASLPVAILIMLVLYVNQVPDRPADERAGKRTIVVRLSPAAIIKGYAIAVAATFAIIVIGAAAGLMPAWTLGALLTAPLAVKVFKALGSSYNSPYELMDAMGKNIMLHFFTGLLLVAGYVAETIA